MAGALACLAGCASAPDKISARPADDIALIGLTCPQLDSERARVETQLAAAERAQRQIRRVDAVGLALLLLPVGSLAGLNHTRQIGDLKGERDAVQEISMRNRCMVPAPTQQSAPNS
jgi:hypothetical protein